ncbi:transposable element Tcb2 transposase [Trichonephila clavipes]|nr:transposable element Tcb2 transposase [Trichonephila clavipes]
MSQALATFFLPFQKGTATTRLPLSSGTWGCGSPVVKVMDHDRHVMSSSPVPLTRHGPVSSRTIRRHLAEGYLGSFGPLLGHSMTPTHQCLRLKWCHTGGNWTVQRNGTRSSFAPTASVMVWSVIAYNSRLPLVLFCGTMPNQRYMHDILEPHVLSLMQRLPGAIFQQHNVHP